MKEQGMFFTEEQKELLREIDKLRKHHEDKDLKFSDGMPEMVFMDQRKTLTILKRMEMAVEISKRYSMLKTDKGIFQDQLFSAMEDYLKKCTDNGYKFEGL